MAITNDTNQTIPGHFICTYKIAGKKALIRVSCWNETEWTLHKWSGAGYWSSNGGGPISFSEASLYFNEGLDVFVVSKKGNSTTKKKLYDVTFEQSLSEWYHKRTSDLCADPNHPEFQTRFDEHHKVFSAMLATKMAMLPKEQQLQVAEALMRSFGEDDDTPQGEEESQ